MHIHFLWLRHYQQKRMVWQFIQIVSSKLLKLMATQIYTRVVKKVLGLTKNQESIHDVVFSEGTIQTLYTRVQILISFDQQLSTWFLLISQRGFCATWLSAVYVVFFAWTFPSHFIADLDRKILDSINNVGSFTENDECLSLHCSGLPVLNIKSILDISEMVFVSPILTEV